MGIKTQLLRKDLLEMYYLLILTVKIMDLATPHTSFLSIAKKLSSILHAHLKYTMKYVAKRKAKLQKENSICWYTFFTFNKYMYSSLCNRQLFVDQGFVKGGNGQFILCQTGQSCFSLSKGQIARIWHLQCCIISIIDKSRKKRYIGYLILHKFYG